MIVEGKMMVPADLLVWNLISSQTRDQEHFTALEMEDDWHELMIPWCIMQPSITPVSE